MVEENGATKREDRVMTEKKEEGFLVAWNYGDVGVDASTDDGDSIDGNCG